MHPESRTRSLIAPFGLSLLLIILDQISKALIVAHIPYHTIGWSWGGDFLWILHTRNLGVAFSIGYGLPDLARSLLFILLPLIVLALVVVYYFRTDELNTLQRWCLASVLGGGLGNQIDRIFRSEGVVDFVSVKFYGLFGLERWPAFNVADSSIVVGGILLAASLIISERRRT